MPVYPIHKIEYTVEGEGVLTGSRSLVVRMGFPTEMGSLHLKGYGHGYCPEECKHIDGQDILKLLRESKIDGKMTDEDVVHFVGGDPLLTNIPWLVDVLREYIPFRCVVVDTPGAFNYDWSFTEREAWGVSASTFLSVGPKPGFSVQKGLLDAAWEFRLYGTSGEERSNWWHNTLSTLEYGNAKAIYSLIPLRIPEDIPYVLEQVLNHPRLRANIPLYRLYRDIDLYSISVFNVKEEK